MKGRLRPAVVWSSAAIGIILVAQVSIGVRGGLEYQALARDVGRWLLMWPIFLVAIWVLTSWRELHEKNYEMGADWAARRTLSGPGPAQHGGAACGRCGAFNPTVAVHCTRCGLRLRNVQVVHALERLPGARDSVPSVLYVLAVVGCLGVGGLTLAAIGEDRFLENVGLMIGGFLGGALASLAGFVALIRWWVRKRALGRAG